jgi:adenine-specific DNA-methyltransferase
MANQQKLELTWVGKENRQRLEPRILLEDSVELGEHCHTHIIPRLKKVIDGEDPGGITKSADWKGGGCFRYYRLAPSLLEKDTWGNWVINRDHNAAMLAEALCKLEGFIYAPSDTLYWQHGYSTESDFIYITTANLNHDQLEQLSDELGPERSLLSSVPPFVPEPTSTPISRSKGFAAGPIALCVEPRR